MKKIILALIVLLALVPSIALAVTPVAWTATSTDIGFIAPNSVNGNVPFLKIPYLNSTSLTNISSFLGRLQLQGYPLSLTASSTSLFDYSTTTSATVTDTLFVPGSLRLNSGAIANGLLKTTQTTNLVGNAVAGTDYLIGGGVSGNCVKWGASNALGDFGAPCSSTGGGGTSFSADTNFDQLVYSTSTPTLWFKSGLYASSTSYYTNISVSNTATSSIGNLAGTLDASTFRDPGEDMGKAINDAYAALPAWGGQITVPLGTYTYTTPIVFNALQKIVRLTCQQGGGYYTPNGTVLVYTAASGDAITINNINFANTGSTIENCKLVGPAGVGGVGSSVITSTRGIYIGGTGTSKGAMNFALLNSAVSGFGTGVYIGESTSFIIIDKNTINKNGRNINSPNVSGANGENLRITNNIIADGNSPTGSISQDCVVLSLSYPNIEWQVIGNSFDDCQISWQATAGVSNLLHLTNNHFENPDPASTCYPFVKMKSGEINDNVVVSTGNDYQQDLNNCSEAILNGGTVISHGDTVNMTSGKLGLTRFITNQDSSNVASWSGLTNLYDHGATTSAMYFVVASTPFAPQGYVVGQQAPSLLIDKAGVNVGIGVTTPAAVLDITNMTAGTPGSAQAVRFGRSSTQYIDFSGDAGADYITNSGVKDFKIYSRTGTGALALGANNAIGVINDIYIATTHNVGLGSTTPWAQLSVNPNGLGSGVPEFVIGSSTKTDFIVSATGNVGVGTTSPQSLFDVQGNTNTSIRLGVRNYSNGTAGDSQLTALNDTGSQATLQMIGSGFTGTLTSYSTTIALANWSRFRSSTAANGLIVSTGGAVPLVFATSDSERARITSAGSFGIGTSSPWRTFSVAGTMAVNGLSASTNKNSVCIDAVTKEFTDSGSTTCPTSSKYGKNITGEITPEVAKYIVDRMKAITFSYKDDGTNHYGFIAEDVAVIDREVKAKFGVDAQLAEYAKEDIFKDGHQYRKDDPINVQYANYTSILTVYMQNFEGNSTPKESNNIIFGIIALLVMYVGYNEYSKRK